MRRLPTVLGACGAAAAVAACGSSGSATDSHPDAPAAVRTHATIVCDSAQPPPRSIAALRRTATSVAVIRPLNAASTMRDHGIPITITRASVLHLVAGRSLPAVIALRQTGAAGVTLEGSCAPLLRAGHEQTAFLVPFRLNRHGSPVNGQYVTVNGGLLDGARKLPR